MAYNKTTSASLTITATSLASGAARSSAAVTTGLTNNTVDIELSVNILTTTTAASGNKQFVIYGYVSEDGTNYLGDSGTVDNVDGTDKTLTALGSPTNLIYIGSIAAAQGAVAVTLRGVFRLAPILGLPRKWGIVIYNDQGTAAGTTITATYTEDYYT